MTNAEKYLKDGESVEELVKAIKSYYYNSPFESELEAVESFLKAPIQPPLTEDERVILKHIDKQFFYIYRWGGVLELTNKEKTWCDYELLVDDEVFQFIKERRRILY